MNEINEIVDLIFEANTNYLKNLIYNKCKIYDDTCNINKIYENNKLVGLFIYKDVENKRYLMEGHYLGKNKFIFLKFWKKSFDKNKHCFTITLIENVRMLKFLLKMKFKICNKDKFNYYLEYLGG